MLKSYIHFKFTDIASNYRDLNIFLIAQKMNMKYGPNEFEEMCLLVVNHWEYLRNRTNKSYFGKKITFDQLYNQIFEIQSVTLDPQSKIETIEIIKFVLDILTIKGLNKDVSNDGG